MSKVQSAPRPWPVALDALHAAHPRHCSPAPRSQTQSKTAAHTPRTHSLAHSSLLSHTLTPTPPHMLHRTQQSGQPAAALVMRRDRTISTISPLPLSCRTVATPQSCASTWRMPPRRTRRRRGLIFGAPAARELLHFYTFMQGNVRRTLLHFYGQNPKLLQKPHPMTSSALETGSKAYHTVLVQL